jgi:hypothetical protein
MMPYENNSNRIAKLEICPSGSGRRNNRTTSGMSHQKAGKMASLPLHAITAVNINITEQKAMTASTANEPMYK